MARHGTRVARKAHLHGDVVSADTCANAPFVQPWYRYLIERAVGDYYCRGDCSDYVAPEEVDRRGVGVAIAAPAGMVLQ